MAVNGVGIAVGQRWRRRDGSVVEIVKVNHGQLYYPVRDAQGGSYTGAGEYYHMAPSRHDLVSLMYTGDSHEALTFGPLDTNPFTPGGAAESLAAEIPHVGAALADHIELLGEEPSELDIEQPAADPGRTNPKDAIGDKKLALHLLSPIAEAHWVIGQYAGMLKYGAWNWRAAGVRASIYISAMRRHLAGYTSGEEFDPVDGSHHLGNIMACAAILLEAREIGKLTDDRPPCFSHRSTYAWAEGMQAQLKVQYADKHPKHYSICDMPPTVERKKADDTEGGAA